MKTYTYALAHRLPHSLDLFDDLVQQLASHAFAVDERACIVYKLCRRGMELARRIDVFDLHRALVLAHGVRPDTKICFVELEDS